MGTLTLWMKESHSLFPTILVHLGKFNVQSLVRGHTSILEAGRGCDGSLPGIQAGWQRDVLLTKQGNSSAWPPLKARSSFSSCYFKATCHGKEMVMMGTRLAHCCALLLQATADRPSASVIAGRSSHIWPWGRASSSPICLQGQTNLDNLQQET